MNAVMNQVIAWLAGFKGVEGAQRVTPDLLEDGDMSLSDLPEDSVTIYVDGTRDVTAYAMFRLRHGVKTTASAWRRRSCWIHSSGRCGGATFAATCRRETPARSSRA